MDGVFVADAHEDVAWACLKDGRAFGDPAPGKALTLPAWQAGQVRLACTTVFAADQPDPISARAHAVKQLDFYDRLLADHPTAVVRPARRADLEGLEGPGPTRMVHLMEGADPVENIDDVAYWKSRGVVAIGPVWNTANRYGGGMDASRGLTPDGFALVRMCGMQGMAVDLSHLNPQAFHDAVDAAMGPVYASHSNASTLCSHRRNLSDAQLKQIADHGGIVGLVFYAPFLHEGAKGTVPVEVLCRHLYHLGRVIGLERVCLGTDFDGGFDATQGVEGLPTCAELPRLVGELQARRHSETAIRGLLGENLRRFIQALLPA